jgi:uncharacterized protein YndB with AHSA1/START domain
MTPTTKSTVTDRIEKQRILRAPRSRVWRALSDPAEFGRWFGCRMEGAFTPGARVRGTMTEPPEWAGFEWDMFVEKVEPERLFSFRWHPGAESAPDDPTTLVTFTLEEAPEGTRLTLVESGFDALPPERRARAFAENEGGWTEQMARIARHVEAG